MLALPATQEIILTQRRKDRQARQDDFFICHALGVQIKRQLFKNRYPVFKKYPPYSYILCALRVFVVHNFLVFYCSNQRVNH